MAWLVSLTMLYPTIQKKVSDFRWNLNLFTQLHACINPFHVQLVQVHANFATNEMFLILYPKPVCV